MRSRVHYLCRVAWVVVAVLPLVEGRAADMPATAGVRPGSFGTNDAIAHPAPPGTKPQAAPGAQAPVLQATNSVPVRPAPALKALAPVKANRLLKPEVVTLARARELASQGKDAEALRICDELIRKGSFDSREALRQKGYCLHRLGRYADACLCWEFLLRGRGTQSADDDIALMLASTYAFTLHDPAKGEKHYQRLLKQTPRSKCLPEARYQYAGTRYLARDYTNAVSMFEAYLRDYPGSVHEGKVNEYLDLCNKALESRELDAMRVAMKADEPSPPPVAPKTRQQRTLDEGEALFARKLYKEAYKTYQEVAYDTFGGERTAAVYRMGQCCSELGKDQEAIRHWEESATLGSRDTNTFYAVHSLKALGDTYFDKLAQEEPAMKAYRKLVATYPDDTLVPEVMEKIGIIYLYEGKPEEAKPIFESLRSATPSDPNEPPSGLDRLIALCVGRNAKQLPDLKMTARRNQGTVALRKGDIFFTARRYEEALKAYNTVETLSKGSEDSARALMQAGRCYRQLGEFRKALECYNHFLVTYRRSSLADDVLMRKASIDCLLEDQGGMTECYKRILNEYPDGDMAWQAQLSLATMAYWSRDWVKALKLHEEFVQKYPNSPCIELVVSKRLPEIKAALDAKKAPQMKKA